MGDCAGKHERTDNESNCEPISISRQNEEQERLSGKYEQNEAPFRTTVRWSGPSSARQMSPPSPPWPRSVRSALEAKPSFKIWNAARTVRKTVQAHSVEELCEKGRWKLELKGALRIVLEADGTEIDEDRILLDPDGPCARKDVVLMLLQIGEKWSKDFLQQKPHEDSISDSLYLLQAIKQHSSELRALIDSEFGLLEELLCLELLNEESYEEVRTRSDHFKRNDCLLHYIKLKSTEKELLDFLDALKNTDQGHISNFLLANGERLDIRYGLDRPLAPKEMSQLRASGPYLLSKLLVTEELLSLLCASRAITDQHKVHISGQRTSNEMISELVNIMKRRSFAAFKGFIRALHLTKQSHVANVLSKPGAIVPMHINIMKNMPLRDIKAMESDLAAKMDEFQNALTDQCREKYNSLWADLKELWLQMELSGIRYKGSCQGNSITVFLWCRDNHAMSRLLQMLESGNLEKMFQQTLIFLANEDLSFSLKIIKKEWKLAEHYFQLSDELNLTSFRVPTVLKAADESRNSPVLEHKIIQQNSVLNILPKELIEIILMQSLVSYVRIPWKEFVPPVGYQAFMLMASVCQEWRKLLTSRTWFSSTMKTYLKKNKHLAILQEHRSIFDQCLEVDCAFLWEMNRNNLLTDEQVLQICSEPNHLKQTEQLFLEVFLHFSAENYAEFYKVLQCTSQSHIANYLEANGVIHLAQHDEWPLNDKSKERLDSAQSRLGDFVPPDEFLDALKTIDCITKIHAEGIASLPDGQKLNELMRILRKRSFVAYRQFAAHLRKLDLFADVAQILATNNRSADVDPMNVDEPRENPQVSPDVNSQGKEPDVASDLKAVELALAEKLLEVGERIHEGHPVTIYDMNQIRTLWLTFERLQPEEPETIMAEDPDATEFHDVDNNNWMTEDMSESEETVPTQWIEDENENTDLNDLCDEQSPICETTEDFIQLAEDPKPTEIREETVPTQWIENRNENTDLNDLCDEQSPICETTEDFNQLAEDPKETEIREETVPTQWIENRNENTDLNDSREQSTICETTENFNLGNSKLAKFHKSHSYALSKVTYRDIIKLLHLLRIGKPQEMSEKSSSDKKDEANKTNTPNSINKLDCQRQKELRQCLAVLKKHFEADYGNPLMENQNLVNQMYLRSISAGNFICK